MAESIGAGYRVAQFFASSIKFSNELHLGTKTKMFAVVSSIALNALFLLGPFLISHAALKFKAKKAGDMPDSLKGTASKIRGAVETPFLKGEVTEPGRSDQSYPDNYLNERVSAAGIELYIQLQLAFAKSDPN